ncbi:formyltransferase family protein, partial [Bacillus altitudinis]|uniref:formyltransferase family protein n=1 Tax=Bacillus altitudinis TaxID=293387 RepID=UPI003B517F6D
MHKLLPLNPHFIITPPFPQIFPKTLLHQPQFPSINLHPSLLPQLTPAPPIHYAILQRKNKTPLTIIYILQNL